jgi:hypothetical protein
LISEDASQDLTEAKVLLAATDAAGAR